MICPYGYYCVEGTTNPVKCQYLVICPPGTKRPQYAIGAILIDIALLVIALIGFIIIRLIQRDRRKKRDKKRQSKEKQKTSSEAAAASSVKDSSAVAANAVTADESQTGFMELAPMLDEFNAATAHVFALDKKRYLLEFEAKDLSFIRKKNER